MKAEELVDGQYFRADGYTDGDMYKKLPPDKKHPNEVLGQVVFLYSLKDRFHSSHIRIFDLNDKVEVV